MSLTYNKNFAVVLGARPNFVKAAPFFKEAKNHPNFRFTLIHTGQHFDENMSKIFFEQMNIPKPDIQLDIKGDFHTEKIGKMFNALKYVLRSDNFDGVIVFGDVNSTLAGALAASKNRFKLVHIEAGLRSHDRRMPEEINRVIVDHLADLLFTSEPSANMNLLKEGVDRERIRYVGNIMIESLEIFKAHIDQSNILNSLNLLPNTYVLATVHRQENTDGAESLGNILKILQEINHYYPVVFPIHPGTKQLINDYSLQDLVNGLLLIDPLGYFDFTNLMKNSWGVITDSGGIQEETSHLGVPCCTIRYNTERPITISQGTNKLFDLDVSQVPQMLTHITNSSRLAGNIPLWDDQVSRRIFKCL